MIQLLDCTLRDGGYINDWEFGQETICNVFERLIDSNVDIIETGFIDDRRPFDVNRSIMPDTAAVSAIYGRILRRPSMVVGMIDYGTCDIRHVQPCEESYLDGIRVIFKKYRMQEAMAYCAQLKELGYLVFAQLVSVTSYSDQELLQLITIANQIKPYAVSIVDTYGLLQPETVGHIYHVLADNLDSDIRIGFHGHNNLQLAFANTIEFLKLSTNRDVIVDGTLYGMGKSAGNAPLELVAMHLNSKYGKQYQLNAMLEAIHESILECYQKWPWGYKMGFYLSALNEVHPDYVKQLQDRENISISALNEMLGQIEPLENRLLYYSENGEKTYNAYEQKHEAEKDNFTAFQEIIEQYPGVLLVGPGKSIKLQTEKVLTFIQQEKPMIISINYLPDEIPIDYVFITKPNRYVEMTCKLLEKQNCKMIVTSNVTPKKNEEALVFSREPLLEQKESIADNSLLMFLRILKKCGLKEIALAGFDGYSDREENYYNAKMEYSFIKREATYLNRHITHALATEFANMKFLFLTYSHYNFIPDSYDAAF